MFTLSIWKLLSDGTEEFNFHHYATVERAKERKADFEHDLKLDYDCDYILEYDILLIETEEC